MIGFILFLISIGFFVLIIFGIAIVCCTISEFHSFNKEYISPSYAHTTPMNWNDILKLYKVNPKRWKYARVITQGCCTLVDDDSIFILYNSGENWTNREKIVRITIPRFSDFLKFQKFLRKNDFNGINSKGLELVLSTTKQDIENLKREAEQQINNANETLSKINENLKNEIELKI